MSKQYFFMLISIIVTGYWLYEMKHKNNKSGAKKRLTTTHKFSLI